MSEKLSPLFNILIVVAMFSFLIFWGVNTFAPDLTSQIGTSVTDAFKNSFSIGS